MYFLFVFTSFGQGTSYECGPVFEPRRHESSSVDWPLEREYTLQLSFRTVAAIQGSVLSTSIEYASQATLLLGGHGRKTYAERVTGCKTV